MNDFSEYSEIKVLKLSNGENIIGRVTDVEGEIEIEDPLQMQIFHKMTETGVMEGLNLTRWLQPFSEETSFFVGNRNIVVSTFASPGLVRYYEYSLKRFEENQAPQPAQMKTKTERMPTNEELDQIEQEMLEDEMDELLESLETKTIH